MPFVHPLKIQAIFPAEEHPKEVFFPSSSELVCAGCRQDMKSNVNAEVMSEKLRVCAGGLQLISALQAQIPINHCTFTRAALLIPKGIAGPTVLVENVTFQCLKADQEVSCQTRGLEGEGFVCFTRFSGKFLAGLKLISSFVFILINSSHLNTRTSCGLFSTLYSKPKHSDSPS